MKQNPKKLISLIVVALCGCLPLYSGAQSSSRHLYKTLTGDNALLCTNSITGNSIITYNSHVNQKPYCFILHKQSSPLNNFYQSSNDAIPPTNTPDSYDVKDIEIVGDRCYFCGTYYTSAFEHLATGPYEEDTVVLVITETGYIGYFELSNIENGVSPMGIAFCVIPGTKTFSKLAGFAGGGNNYLCLVGKTAGGLSCLSTMKDNMYSIAYGLHILPSSETLTDLAFTENYLVTVSRLNDETYSFGLRAETTGYIIKSLNTSCPLQSFKYFNKYITAGINTLSIPRPENPTFHLKDVEMKIARIPGYDHAVVAYDCMGGAFDAECNTDLHHTALYYVDISNYPMVIPINIIDAQIVSKGREFENSLTGLACPDQYSAILFHRYPVVADGISGEIQFPLWTMFGQIDNLAADGQDMQDMYYDPYNQKINLTGNPGTDSRIVHFQQDFNSTKSSCYSPRPKAISERLALPDVELLGPDIDYLYGIIPWGNVLNRPRLQVNYGTTCETY